MNRVQMGQSVVGRWRVEGGWDLQLKCARVLHETLLVPVLMYGSKTVLRKEEEIFRIRAMQIYNLRGSLEPRMHG